MRECAFSTRRDRPCYEVFHPDTPAGANFVASGPELMNGGASLVL